MKDIGNKYVDRLLVKAICLLAMESPDAANCLRKATLLIQEGKSTEISQWQLTILVSPGRSSLISRYRDALEQVFGYLASVEGRTVGSVEIKELSASRSLTISSDFIALLKQQQRDFIGRLVQSPAAILQCNTVGSHSESITISTEDTTRIRKFC